MKRLFALVALCAVVMFAGCSKDDDKKNPGGNGGGSEPNVETYTGEFLGTWSCSDPYNSTEEVFTFNSDKTYKREVNYSDGEWEHNTGTFEVKNNQIAVICTRLDYSDADSTDTTKEDQMVAYYNTGECDDTTLEMEFIVELHTQTIDFDYIYDNYINNEEYSPDFDTFIKK